MSESEKINKFTLTVWVGCALFAVGAWTVVAKLSWIVIHQENQMIKYPQVNVRLSGTEGNAFAVLGKVQEAMRRAKVDSTGFLDEAMSGDYDHLLAVCQQWVTVI